MTASSGLLAILAASLLATVSGQTACLYETSSTVTYVANPTSCSAWIACSSGKVVNTGTCATGYLFNNATGSCETASSVTCSDTTLENICVGQTDGSYVANPDNCKSYFYCDNSIGYAGLCNSNYYWNSTLKVCAYGANYTCPTSTSNKSSTSSLTCSDVPDGTFLPNNASCSAYYVCVDGKPIAGSCNTTIPLYFDSATGSCNYASEVTCDISDTVESSQISIPYNYTAICATTNSTALFASDPANCTGYFYCSSTTDTSPSHGNCPDGLYFDANTQKCASASSVTCTIQPCVNQPVGYFAINNASCADYYYCSASGKQAGSCTTGYYFDVENQDCNSPSAVTCTIATTTTSSTSSNSTSSTTASSSSSTSTTTDTSTSTTTSTTASTTSTTA